jgi:hypothetical protein
MEANWHRGNGPRHRTNSTMETIPFRAVVRGTNIAGARVRRVRTLRTPTYEAAWASLGDVYAEMTAGLCDPTANVLPPVGLRLDGSASVGYE